MKLEVKCPNCDDLFQIEINELFEVISIIKINNTYEKIEGYKNLEFGIIE